jgi:hypothetical protein
VDEPAARERALQRLVTAFISAGLIFLLLPGTFLGVWNLIAISHHRAAHSFSSAWIQAHGQAQMFGWIGTFVIGIGFYSLSKMGRLKPFVVSRGWQSWTLWTAGIALHWLAGVYEWRWRLLLPLSLCSPAFCSSSLQCASTGRTRARFPWYSRNQCGCAW